MLRCVALFCSVYQMQLRVGLTVRVVQLEGVLCVAVRCTVLQCLSDAAACGAHSTCCAARRCSVCCGALQCVVTR